MSTYESDNESVVRSNYGWNSVEAIQAGTANLTIEYSDGTERVCHITVAASLPTLKIPVGVTTIEAEAFAGDTGVKRIEIDSAVQTIESGAFANMGAVLVRIEDGTITIQDGAFSNTNAVFICPENSDSYNYAKYHSIPVFVSID